MYHFTEDQIHSLFIGLHAAERFLTKAEEGHDINNARLFSYIVEEYADILHVLELEEDYREWVEKWKKDQQ